MSKRIERINKLLKEELNKIILKEVDFSWPMAQATLQHHEKLDGSGYPAGISGSEIIMEARMLAVADVVEEISTLPTRTFFFVDDIINGSPRRARELFRALIALKVSWGAQATASLAGDSKKNCKSQGCHSDG